MNIIDYIKQLFSNGKKNATIYTKILKKPYGDKQPLEIGLYGGKTPIPNEDVGIEINNKQYIRTTDNDGVAKLNINLPVGEYSAKIYWRGNKEYNKTTAYVDVIITTDTYMDGINLTKNEGDSTPYQCAVYRKDNNARIKDEVTIIINGISYVRSADNDGLYKLNINLKQGTYDITAKYNGSTIFNPSTVNNTITINKKPQTNKKPVILGCDANTDNDKNVQNAIASKLEQNGYDVEKLAIGPNYFASTDYSEKAKGKIGIYLIASGIFSIADAAYGSGQFDNYIFGIRGDFGDKGATCFDCPISADADCTSICDKLNGKTFNQMNNMLQPYVAICGGANTDELANNIIDWLSTIDKKDDPSPKPEPGLWDYFTQQGGGYLGQKNSVNCGPHSLMQCIHRLTGEDVSEMTLASVCGTTSDGTDHQGLETGLAWFNREYGYNLKMEWKNFSEVGFEGTQQLIDNGACFHHIYYRLYAGHYEVPKWTGGDPIYVLNSLGDQCGDGYCGYIEERSRSTHQAYINGISQKSVCIITRG